MRAPFAAWEPTPVNFTSRGVIRPARGMVVHTAVGSYEGTIQWFRNPKAKVSSYFVVAQDGRIAQCVDTDDKAWTQAAGNAAWIGVENEGNPTIPFTPAQITANAKILAWLHQTFGVALQLTTDPNSGDGLGYHSMGGVSWSPNHHQCPGATIVAQLPEIVAEAKRLVGTPVPPPTPKVHPVIVANTPPVDAKVIDGKPIVLTRDGGVFAPKGGFCGTPVGQAYWHGHLAAALAVAGDPQHPLTTAEVNAGKKYAVIADDGSRFAYPA